MPITLTFHVLCWTVTIRVKAETATGQGDGF